MATVRELRRQDGKGVRLLGGAVFLTCMRVGGRAHYGQLSGAEVTSRELDRYAASLLASGQEAADLATAFTGRAAATDTD